MFYRLLASLLNDRPARKKTPDSVGANGRLRIDRGLGAGMGARLPSDPKKAESFERIAPIIVRSQLIAATPSGEAAVTRASARDA